MWQSYNISEDSETQQTGKTVKGKGIRNKNHKQRKSENTLRIFPYTHTHTLCLSLSLSEKDEAHHLVTLSEIRN